MIFGSCPEFYSFKKYVDNVVLFVGEGLLTLALCLLYLLLKYHVWQHLLERQPLIVMQLFIMVHPIFVRKLDLLY